MNLILAGLLIASTLSNPNRSETLYAMVRQVNVASFWTASHITCSELTSIRCSLQNWCCSHTGRRQGQCILTVTGQNTDTTHNMFQCFWSLPKLESIWIVNVFIGLCFLYGMYPRFFPPVLIISFVGCRHHNKHSVRNTVVCVGLCAWNRLHFKN